MANISVAMPTSALVDATGNVTPAWRAYFQILLDRTGGTAGQSTADATTALGQETTARTNADAALNTAILNEANARIAADNDLAARFAGTDLSGLPTANPGGGKPWLSAGNVHVGP